MASPPTARRRPSWDSWIRPSLTDARPSPVRVKSVIRPWCARVASAALCFTSTICRLWLPPCEPPRDLPPRTNATRTNTRRTPHRTRPNDERTQNEQLTNTHAPARQASRESTRPVASPCEVRHKPVSCPWEGRKKSVICPCEVRRPSVRCPYVAYKADCGAFEHAKRRFTTVSRGPQNSLSPEFSPKPPPRGERKSPVKGRGMRRWGR